jgi:hypothetical protein
MTRHEAIAILGLRSELELELEGDRYAATTGELVRCARLKLEREGWVEIEIVVEERGAA